jgi:hypothetical protein
MPSESIHPLTPRLCPTVEGQQGARLVAQDITVGTCHRRQEKGYHKCSRCTFHEAVRVKRELVAISMW